MSQPVLSQNQFSQTPFLGTVDQRFNYNTTAVEVDLSQTGTMYAGMAVKVVNSADGIPKVLKCTASTDEVFGWINFDIKTKVYAAGDRMEISQTGNVIYLLSTTAIARGGQVTLDVTTDGGVGALVAASGKNVVGYAMDQASGAGVLIRVHVNSPSYQFA